MKKILIIVMVISMTLAFCSCGSTEEVSEEPTAYSPVDIQVEAIEDEDANVYHVIYDIDALDEEQWTGRWDDRESQTAINGIKEVISRDDWTPTSVIYGEDKSGALLYSYGFNGIDGDYQSVKFYVGNMFHKSYGLDGLI